MRNSKKKAVTVTVNFFSGKKKKPFATAEIPKLWLKHLEEIAKITGTTLDIVFQVALADYMMRDS